MRESDAGVFTQAGPTTDITRFDHRLCRIGALGRALHTSDYHRERGQGFPRAVCVALFEIVTGLPHGVGDMGEAKHSHSGRASKCVEGRRLHLDR